MPPGQSSVLEFKSVIVGIKSSARHILSQLLADKLTRNFDVLYYLVYIKSAPNLRQIGLTGTERRNFGGKKDQTKFQSRALLKRLHFPFPSTERDQEVGFTEPMAHFLADISTLPLCPFLVNTWLILYK